MLNERTEQENNTVIKYMKQTFSVFDEIPDDQMVEIAGKFVPAEFRPGELLCRVDEVSDHLIILYEGRVQILR